MVAGKPPHRLLASSLLLRGARAPHQINTATPTPRTQHQPIYRREKGPKSEKNQETGMRRNEQMRKWKMLYPHQTKIATPTPSPPSDPVHGKKNIQRRKRRKNKGEKQQDEIWFFKPDQCVHTNTCTTNQPIHCTALKHDRKNENWSLKVEFSRCKRAAKFEGNRPNSLIDDYVFHLSHPKFMHQK